VEELFPEEAENYLSEIEDPIDLKMISRRLEDGYYITIHMFKAGKEREGEGEGKGRGNGEVAK
jgi:hypothetical protein